MNTKKNIDLFVSVALVIQDQRDNYFRTAIPKLATYLSERYNDYEIIVIDNSRSEAVDSAVSSLLSQVESVRYIKLTTKVDEEVCWGASLDNCIGDVIVFFDHKSDPFGAIQNVVALAAGGVEAIVGVADDKATFAYRCIRPLINWGLKAIDYKLPKNATNLWCISRRVVNAVSYAGSFHQQLYAKIYDTGYDVKSFEYEKLQGKINNKTLSRGADRALRQIVFNSSRPLRWMTMLGAFGSLLAFIFGVYSIITRTVNNDVVEGWTSLVLVISLLFMMMFVILAFFGEYLGRLLDDRNDRRNYEIATEKCSKIMLNEDRFNISEH